eukprot:2003629-Prymnesium_polylepis.1
MNVKQATWTLHCKHKHTRVRARMCLLHAPRGSSARAHITVLPVHRSGLDAPGSAASSICLCTPRSITVLAHRQAHTCCVRSRPAVGAAKYASAVKKGERGCGVYKRNTSTPVGTDGSLDEIAQDGCTDISGTA